MAVSAPRRPYHAKDFALMAETINTTTAEATKDRAVRPRSMPNGLVYLLIVVVTLALDLAIIAIVWHMLP
jgi:hypothetical protein